MKWAFPALLFALLAAPALKLLARTSDAAERKIAAFLLLLGAGLALRIGAVGDNELLVSANLAGHVALSLAGVPLFRVTRSVFRPEEPWALWLERAGIVVTFAVLPLLWLDRGFANEQARSILVVNGSRVHGRWPRCCATGA